MRTAAPPDPCLTMAVLLNPHALWRELDGARPEALERAFDEAHSFGSSGGVAMIVCVGLAQTRSEPGGLKRPVVKFGIHRSTLARLARAWREIIHPRLLREGTKARFPLGGQEWYRVACEAAKSVGRSALELLEEAERSRAADAQYSVNRWKSDLSLQAAHARADTARAAAASSRRGRPRRPLPANADEMVTELSGQPRSCSDEEIAVRQARYPENFVPLDEVMPPQPLRPPRFEWLFISIDGVYRAAKGKSEMAVGHHWKQVTKDRDIVLDGGRMSCDAAWSKLVADSAAEGMELPSIAIFPDIEDQFSLRPDASGAMECLIVAVRAQGQVAGFLFLDFSEEKDFPFRSPHTYHYLRDQLRPLTDRLQHEFSPSALATPH
ncbi:MAG: hypothetical protein VCC00_06260 [Deltaproteobacteria bacterium]